MRKLHSLSPCGKILVSTNAYLMCAGICRQTRSMQRCQLCSRSQLLQTAGAAYVKIMNYSRSWQNVVSQLKVAFLSLLDVQPKITSSANRTEFKRKDQTNAEHREQDSACRHLCSGRLSTCRPEN